MPRGGWTGEQGILRAETLLLVHGGHSVQSSKSIEMDNTAWTLASTTDPGLQPLSAVTYQL